MRDNRNSKKSKKASQEQTAKHFRVIVEIMRLLSGHDGTTPTSSDIYQHSAGITMSVQHEQTQAQPDVTLEFVQTLQCDPQRGYHDPTRTGFD